jgi:hypothetical protein
MIPPDVDYGRSRAASPVNAWLHRRNVLGAGPRTRVVGVSLDDRSAILMGGFRRRRARFENDGGNFITSTFYMAKRRLIWRGTRRERSICSRWLDASAA